MEALWLGLGLGLAAGVSPGPLLTLTLTSTLERGFAAGLRVAVAPLLGDLPVVVLSLGALAAAPEGFLGAIGLVGGLFVVYLGLDGLRKSATPLALGGGQAISPAVDLWRGALVNLLNPNPWLFWLTVGGPRSVSLWRDESPLLAVGFFALFYTGLVGSKIALAALAARGRRRLAGPWYRRILVGCGLLLILFGGLLGYDGWQRLMARPR